MTYVAVATTFANSIASAPVGVVGFVGAVAAAAAAVKVSYVAGPSRISLFGGFALLILCFLSQNNQYSHEPQSQLQLQLILLLQERQVKRFSFIL